MNEVKNEITIEKPFSMIYEEFKMGLANLINNSNLPMSVIESILEIFLNEAKGLAKQQYQNDRVRYEKLLFEQDGEDKEVKKKLDGKK